MLGLYDVWGEQEWQGKKYMGVARTIVTKENDGAEVYKNVNLVGHAVLDL